MEFLNFLDTIKLPFELPILLHPVTVHFAIAIPIIIFLLEITNLLIKKPYINVISSTFLFLVVLVFTAAFFAGKADGTHAFSLLSPEGKEELKVHKTLGMYLVYLSVFVFVLKLLSLVIKKEWMKGIFFLSLIAFIGLTLKQGKYGGELVYEYGTNVEMVSKLDDKLMEMEDEVDELKSKLQKCQTKIDELSKKETQSASETKVKTEEETKAEQKSEETTKSTKIKTSQETNTTANETHKEEKSQESNTTSTNGE